jgi:hypothetical protein
VMASPRRRRRITEGIKVIARTMERLILMSLRWFELLSF